MTEDDERQDEAAEPAADAAAPPTDASAPNEQLEDETAGTGAAAGRTRQRPAKATALTAAAVVSIGALLGASGYITVRHHSAAQQHQRAAAFTAAARQGVINMTSLDFQHPDEDIQRVLDNATGEFKDDFAGKAADFVKAAKQSQVISMGTVNAAGIESMGPDSAVVLVSATSFVTNSAGAKDEPRTWRLRVTVSEDGDQIKMSKLMYVP